MSEAITCHNRSPMYSGYTPEWREAFIPTAEVPLCSWGGTGRHYDGVRPWRSCTYCGSIHPEDLIAALKAGATLHGADWKYSAPPWVIGYDTIQSWEWKKLLSDPSGDGARLRSYVQSAIASGKYRVTASTSPNSPRTIWVGPSANADHAPNESTMLLGSLGLTRETLPKQDDKNSEFGLSTTSEGSVPPAAICMTGQTLPSSTSTTETPPKKRSAFLYAATHGNESESSATSATSSALTATACDIQIAIERQRPHGWPHKLYVEDIPNPYPDVPTSASHQFFTVDGKQTVTCEVRPAGPLLDGKWYNEHLSDLRDTPLFDELAALIEERAGIKFEFDPDGQLKYRAPYHNYQR